MDTTKRPWRVNEAHIRHCLGCDGYITIAESVGYGPKDENRQICEMNSSDSPAEVLANARLIVKAVNLFDELVAALTECLGVLIEPGIMDVDEWKAWQHQAVAEAHALLKRIKGE